MLDDSDGQTLLTGVSSVEHKASNESFDNGALDLSEFLELVSSSCVRNEDLGLSGGDGNVVLETDIIDLNFSIIPFAEQFELASVVNLGLVNRDG